MLSVNLKTKNPHNANENFQGHGILYASAYRSSYCVSSSPELQSLVIRHSYLFGTHSFLNVAFECTPKK